MIREAVGNDGTVTLRGLVDEDLRIDGEPEDVTYELVLHPDIARLVAGDLARPHEGVRLYDATGTVGPVDGQALEVLEVGTYREAGLTALCVTIPQANRPEALARLQVEFLQTDEAARCADLLTAAADDAR